MIKKLHYVWFGQKQLPANVRQCIDSWKKYCPDWDIIQWNEDNFDVQRFRWVREALKVGKYAFAADFVRLYVLKHYGGGYLDTDVQILRNIENVIDGAFVSGIENHNIDTNELEGVTEDGYYIKTGKQCWSFCLQAGFMYSEPNHPFINYCMESLYKNGDKPFINLDGTINAVVIDSLMMMALRDKYGIIYRDTTQVLPDNIKIYVSSVFATRKSRNKDSYMIHWFDQSWRENDLISMRLKKFIKKYLYFLYRKL